MQGRSPTTMTVREEIACASPGAPIFPRPGDQCSAHHAGSENRRISLGDDAAGSFALRQRTLEDVEPLLRRPAVEGERREHRDRGAGGGHEEAVLAATLSDLRGGVFVAGFGGDGHPANADLVEVHRAEAIGDVGR